MEVTNYFDGVATKWDEMRDNYFTEAMRDAAIALVPLTQSSVVADMGTGTGFVVEGLAPLVGKVTGFDASEQMLLVARENLSAYLNVDFVKIEQSKIPCDSDTFDALFANMYLHHEETPCEAIKELVRVLKPGGWLVITDLDAHEEAWMREEMADRWLGFARAQIGSWFNECKLSNVSITDAQGGCCTRRPSGDDLKLSIFVAMGQKLSLP